jgi:hypothetical protein
MLHKNKYGFWHINLTIDGETVRKSLRTKDEKTAKQLHTKIENELLTGEWRGKNRNVMTLGDAFKQAVIKHWKGTKAGYKVEENWATMTRDKHIDPKMDVTKFKMKEVD